jgi:hypothetical protein
MAKGLRSKSMRKNRSFLRKTVMDPIIEKRQEALQEKLQKTLASKDPTTLLSLKNILPTSSTIQKKNQEGEADQDEMDDDEDEEEEEAPVVQKKSKKQNPYKKDKSNKETKPKQKKELVWFK